MEDLVKLERRIQAMYDEALLPVAKKFQYQLPTSSREAARRPCVLFLGNHSSGKSSFINYLIEQNLQKTGLAPTDDGFTIISYAEQEDELDGQSVVTHPDIGFRHLQRLGPNFLARFRMKTNPHPLLKSLTLIDSPGMIDASGSSITRGYDFAASVRMFSEAADLILFFFDPDKPGTTGEAISMFTETLNGLDHKLLIIINKMDSFSNIRDFARTYGALCWNLSKLIKTKDVPQFFNTYIPGANPTLESEHTHCIPLKDFDDSREEVIHEIKRAPVRRADNLVSDLYNHVCRLSMLTRVCTEAANRFRTLRFKVRSLAVVLAVLGAAAAILAWNPENWMTTLVLAGVTIAAVAGVLFGGRIILGRMRRRLHDPDYLTLVFKEIYREPLAASDRADLLGTWQLVCRQTVNTLNLIGLENIPRAFKMRKPLRRLEQILDREIPKLRRKIAGITPEELAEQAERRSESSFLPASEEAEAAYQAKSA